MTRPVLLGSCLLALATPAAASTAELRQIDPPALHEIRTSPFPIRDNVVRKPLRATAAQSSAVYRTREGYRVRVIVSRSYPPSAQADRQYVDFVDGLIHGPELHGLTLVVAPPREISALCEDAASLACYDALSEVIFIPGEEYGHGAPPLASVLTHEYGHHVARNRSNAPWPAFHWGPKLWATQMNVCERAAAGKARPGDEGAGYSSNPAEAWAESYVVLHGGAWSGIVDAGFKPDAAALAAARRDVRSPWTRNTTRTYRRQLRAGRTWRRTFALVDGSVSLYVRGPRGLRYRATLSDATSGEVLQRRTRSRSGRALGHRACGVRRATVSLRVQRGRGPFTLVLSRP